MFDAATAEQVRWLVAKGVFGIGVFVTADCRATHDDLKSKGVQFMSPPTDRFHGIEALAWDNSGNWCSLTERKAWSS